MMKPSSARRGRGIRPLYFFDQPSKQKGIPAAANVPPLNLAHQGTQVGNSSGRNDQEEGKTEVGPAEGRSDGTGADGEPDTPLPMTAFSMKELTEQVAPQLLDELAIILGRHKWGKKRRVPGGIEDLLGEPWKALTAGRESAEQEGRSSRSGEPQPGRAPSRRESVPDGRKEGRPPVKGGAPVRERKEGENGSSKRRKQRAHSSTTITMPLLSSSCKQKGWIIQPKQPSCDGPEWIRLSQWVAERLEVARNLEKLQVNDQDLAKTQTVRYYDESKLKPTDRNWKKKNQSAALLRATHKLKEKLRSGPTKLKLHHKLNDGSSTIYYPSGYIAVCQSRSSLPRGGFYTNVFSDSMRPVVLATITAFGHGTVTQSSAIKAVWHQEGGFKINQQGIITEVWSWRIRHTKRKNIAMQVSDVISVRLLSGTSAVLIFRCSSHSVQLPLSAMPYKIQPKESTRVKLISTTGRDILLEREKNPRIKPVPEGTFKVIPLEKQVQMLKELSAHKGWNPGWDLKRLQQRVQKTLNNWTDFYRAAMGIKCHDGKRVAGAPPRTRQSALLHSLNPPERAAQKAARASKNRKELKKVKGHLSAPAGGTPGSSSRLPRKERKKPQQDIPSPEAEPCYADVIIRLGAGLHPFAPEWQPPPLERRPASFTPTVPVTLCPILLRAALLGEAGRRRCYCSAAHMPEVMDLEYDTFITGQPPHSQQILVVCVTRMPQHSDEMTEPEEEVLDQLYRSRNRNRTAPCTQCQMDSFRLVKYKMSYGRASCRAPNMLLRKRHNAAPGMVVMYMGGTLLFIGYAFSAHSCSEKDLQKQISRIRVDHRLGVSLPSDYKFCEAADASAATCAHSSKILHKKEEKT
ncbi:uncharacterized protein C3orf20-like isoform X2 [Nelusetta ayraudi]|uniref:uncharacterized protein C3orf20-like isoform X2 n=1 Tax=Nelusetta ayraudi TaxID=303726 RepID=UPI003F704C84